QLTSSARVTSGPRRILEMSNPHVKKPAGNSYTKFSHLVIIHSLHSVCARICHMITNNVYSLVIVHHDTNYLSV
uniref:Uncharacterized protein n=1 Tax=Aegilops tauschii subsp. strangulata TaxID=200361 RepID=A0A453LJD5_AEGTS